MGLFKPNVERLAQKSDVKGLVNVLLYEKDVNIRCAAAEALGKIGNSQAIEPLVTTLRDTDKYVQEAACQALVHLGEKAVGLPLIYASSQGDIETVKLLLENGADVNAKNYLGETALICASIKGDIETVKLLLENGADVNAKNKRGTTALIYSSYKGREKTANLLIENGADVNIINNDGETALIYASNKGCIEAVKLLLENGADVKPEEKAFNKTALMRASSQGDVEIVSLLIEKGADVNIKSKQGMTALIHSSEEGHTETANLLLEKGADINIKNNLGETALILASGWGHTETANLLIEKGADASIIDSYGMTALIRATKAGHPETARLIIEKCTDVKVDTETEKLLARNINARLDSAGKNIYWWFIEHNGQRVQFSTTTGAGVHVGDLATIDTSYSLKPRSDGFVYIQMVKGVIGSPSGLEIPMISNSFGIYIESYKVSTRELSWKDITPGYYGGFRYYLVRLV